MGWGGYYEWRPYVPVRQKLAKAAKRAAQLAQKQGRQPSPVKLDGRTIARSFWGKAWCDNLTAYSDYSNRLPRGATYVRNGSVVDLLIKPRAVEALVAGSEPYTIRIEIAPLTKPAWKAIKQDCSASIDSLLDLLAGRFSDGVMRRLTRQKDGLFPSPREITMKCSCPDWSDCCKHLAAVMYGIGARLDKQPELLFLLRDVDHQELVSQAVAEGNLEKELSAGTDGSLAGQDLGSIFGIELDSISATAQQPTASNRRRRVNGAPMSKLGTKAPGKTKAHRKSKVTSGPGGAADPSVNLKKPEKPKVARKAVAKKLTATKKKSVALQKTGHPANTPSQKPVAKKGLRKRAMRKMA